MSISIGRPGCRTSMSRWCRMPRALPRTPANVRSTATKKTSLRFRLCARQPDFTTAGFDILRRPYRARSMKFIARPAYGNHRTAVSSTLRSIRLARSVTLRWLHRRPRPSLDAADTRAPTPTTSIADGGCRADELRSGGYGEPFDAPRALPSVGWVYELDLAPFLAKVS